MNRFKAYTLYDLYINLNERSEDILVTTFVLNSCSKTLISDAFYS